MECLDCSTSTSTTTDVDSVLISVSDLKDEALISSNLCNEECLTEKDVDDLSGLDNLEILNTCGDRDLYNPKVMDCLSDFPESFDINIPPIENVDSVLPMYGPYPEFESPAPFEADVVDVHAVPGVCGLRNLGNTCFMNAGLQCLLNNKIFKDYFCERDLDSFVKGTLTFKFAEIIKKFWSGTFSILHLGEFKECFGAMHIQFRNFRQHDCQEFLALLLDSMHEELNVASKRNQIDHPLLVDKMSKEVTLNKCYEGDNDCDKKMEVCEKEDKSEKVFESSSPETSEQSLSDTGSTTSEAPTTESTANNIKELNRVYEMLKRKNIFDSSGPYEKNTEKMADLLINNNKLDKILNKNEFDVMHNPNENSFVKSKISEENHVLSVDKLEKNELACQFNTSRKIPSIEDFVKDTKTLNTNVLVPDETNNLLKFDSEKFPKHESNRLQETVDNLGQIVDFGVKQGGIKRVKMTNLVHEKHKMLESNCETSSCSGLNKRLKIENMETNLDSPANEQDDAVEMESVPCDEYSEGSSQSSELYSLNTECRGLIFADEIRRAYSHWNQYKLLNQSVIVDTFHGQFRSSVVCSQCSHNSITYEPFMYLPVFLPHALERQIVITFVQNNGTPPVCYLVNVNKFDRIHKIREALQRLLDVAPEEIILAEVFEHHISRILDENQCIRRVNDASRSVYAFEVGKMCEQNLDSSKNSNAIPLGFSEINPDLNNYSNGSSMFQSTEDKSESQSVDNCDSSSSLDNKQIDEVSASKFEMPQNSVQDNSALNFAGSLHRSCAICLEDYPDYNLSLHPECECILCSHCIEVSCKHYGSGSFICPVCTASVSPTEDFVPLNRIGEYKFKVNTIPVPILMRHDSYEDGVIKEKVLIGHPGLLKLPSTLPAVKLYEHVDNAIPFLSTYSLLLVDGQGKNCSRCLFSEHCSGCEIARSGDIKLHSGDNIAVRYTDLPAECLTSASLVTEHKSMQQTRHKTDLDIYDCLEYFSERESLDEDSPWFCPVCRRNQQATKSLSVWKFPEVLIICLKRFVFHDFMSIKVEDKVTYPLEGLDLSSFSSGPFSGELIYDLQACVCHFGGVSAGHYTSYSKHSVSNEWYNQNDENVKKEGPNTDDSVSEYILFYQKRSFKAMPEYAITEYSE